MEKEKVVVKKVNDPTNNNWCGLRGVWEIYPDDSWDSKKWGPKPFLGYARGDSEYWAVYAAYNKGIARPNSTFGYVAVKARKFVVGI